QMVTANGFPLEPAIFLPANAMSVTVGQDGLVTVTQPANTPHNQVGQLTCAMIMNDAGLAGRGGHFFVATHASSAPTESLPGMNGAGTLFQGFVEASNVNVVEEMVNMILPQRAYEINSRAISSSDEMLARLSQL